jgi:hypothetical protein
VEGFVAFFIGGARHHELASFLPNVKAFMKGEREFALWAFHFEEGILPFYLDTSRDSYR